MYGVKGEQQYAERAFANTQMQEKDAGVINENSNLDDPVQREEYKRDYCCWPIHLECC